jgi:ribosome-interacting GTPase 1
VFIQRGEEVNIKFCIANTFLNNPALPDFAEAIVLREGATVETVCRMIHKDLVSQFKSALVWVRINHLVNIIIKNLQGTSAKHTPQKVGLGKYFI